MTQQIDLNLITQPLLECLDETFNTTHGIYLDRGTSLFPTLEGVSAEEASRRISSNTATLAAQVDHVRFYLDVLNDIMVSGQIVKVDWREIWNRMSSVTPEEWEDLKRRLGESHERVMTTIASFDKWDGKYDFGGTLSVLAHTAYHLGGIRQALVALRSDS